MSLSRNLQNILDETLNSLLFMDISFNLPLNTYTEEEEDTTSLPDLIPIVEESNVNGNENEINENGINRNLENLENLEEENTRRRLRLWSNLLLDYNSQMTTYQTNIQSILYITDNILFHPNRNRNLNLNRNRNLTTEPDTNRLLQLLLRNPSPYILELDTIPIFGSRNTNTNTNTNAPTAFQIQTATRLFNYNPQEDPLTISTCPITLEEFHEGETLMCIHGCGHIFKAAALHRWFLRNHRCPSCRYNIQEPR